jgi:uncharacterized cupredoxin-like copper-binding protein
MSFKRFILASACVAALAGPAWADTHIKVQLNNTDAAMDMSKDMGFTPGSGADMSKAMMSIVVDQASVPAGKVTFDVVNESKETIHEMLVAPYADASPKLPYVAAENRADEDAAGHLGEVSELEPGKGGSLTLDLKAGKYILFCNVPGHLSAGMWTVVEVK